MIYVQEMNLPESSATPAYLSQSILHDSRAVLDSSVAFGPPTNLEPAVVG